MTKQIPYDRYSPLIQLIMVLCISFGFMTTVGSALSWIATFIITGDTALFSNLLGGGAELKRENTLILLLIQGIVSISGFIIFPLLWIRYIWKFQVIDLIPVSSKISSYLILLLCMVTLIIIILPVTEWNKSISLPVSFGELENYFKRLEQQAESQIEMFTDFSSHWHFIFSIIVLALLPSLGEELLFRGILQPIIIKMTKNYHVGIFLSAMLFSAFHLQFYGFFPRLIYGIFFGYLFYYTNSLIPSIICHFFNNGLTLVMIFLFKIDVMASDYMNENDVPTFLVLIMLPLFFIFGYLFLNLTKRERSKI